MSPRFSVSPGFLLLAAWFTLANGWRTLLTVLAAAAVHELGHCLVLRALGARISGLRIDLLGAELTADRSALSYGGELASVLAGPAANLLCALALTLLGGGGHFAAGAELVLCAVNLLPVRPLDGGQALYLLVSWRAGPGAGESAARWAGAACAFPLASLLIYVMWRTRGSFWLLPPALGLLAAGTGAVLGRGAA